MFPISCPTRSRPRTTMVSAFEALMAVLRCCCDPIFMCFSDSENYFVLRTHREPSHRGRQVVGAFFAYRIEFAPMPAKKRREAMGGLAKGLAVIRTFGSDHATLTLSDIARSAKMPAATARRCLLT